MKRPRRFLQGLQAAKTGPGRGSWRQVRDENIHFRDALEIKSCQSREETVDFGFVKDIGCRFHGWKFNLDGTNQSVTDSETFRDEVLCYDLDLSSVKVEEECGFVWVTMHENPHAC